MSGLSPSLTTLGPSTFIGGSGGIENVIAIAVSPSGEVYATGATESTDFPGISRSAQPGFGGFLDAYVARFDPTLRILRQATYLGGTRSDYSNDLAIAGTGAIYVTGTTESSDFRELPAVLRPPSAVPRARGFRILSCHCYLRGWRAGRFTDSHAVARRDGSPGDPADRRAFMVLRLRG